MKLTGAQIRDLIVKKTESYDPDRTVLVVTTDDDTVNDTVKHPQTRTRTTTPYNN